MKKTPPFGGVDSVISEKKITESRLIQFLTRIWRYKMIMKPFYQELGNL